MVAGAMLLVVAAGLAGCWGKKPDVPNAGEPLTRVGARAFADAVADVHVPNAGEPLTLVGGMAKVEKVTPDLFYAIAKTDEGRRTIYWDDRTFFFRGGEPIKGEVTLHPGDRFEFRGMEAHGEIYLTRVNLEK